MSTAIPSSASPAASMPAPQTFREVLGNLVMRRLWYAQIVSLFGDFLALFAVISVVTFKMHGTPAQITGVQIAYMLPLSLIGPIAGVLVDRWSLKATLVASDLVRAGLVVLLIFSTQLWQVYVVLGFLSLVSAFFTPAQSVSIRSHVPRHGLLSANSLMQLAMMGSRIIGPATAGALVSAFGPASCYAIDVASFVASASLIFSVSILRPPELQATSQAGDAGKIRAVWIDLKEGLRFILHHRAMLFVVAAMAAGLFTLGCFGPLIAVYVRDSLHASPAVFGITSGMIGVGLIVGTLSVRRLATRYSNTGLVLAGLAGIGVGALLLGSIPNIAFALLGTFTVGLTFSGVMVPSQTLMQQETPIALAGRISSSVMSVLFLTQILGLLLSGVMANELGVRAVFLICGALAFALAGAGKLVLSKSKKAAPAGA